MTEPRRTFPRSHRLSGRLAFASVFEARARKSSGPLTLLTRPNDLPHNRLGLSVGRRIGSAVRRNRIKRLLREAFRLTQHELPQGYDIVVVVHPHEPLTLEEYQHHLAAALAQGDALWRKRKRRRE